MMTPRYTITVIFVVALAATLGAIGWETDWGRAFSGDPPSPSASRVATLDSKILPAHALGPMDMNYKETVERPLFISSRRPAPPSNATSQTALRKGQFKLTGTTVSAGISVAYLFETATNKTHYVNLGRDINGIKVERVEATRVLLRQGDESEELSLVTSQSPKVVPPLVAAVSPAPGQVAAMPGEAGFGPGQTSGVMPPSAIAGGAGAGPLPTQAVQGGRPIDAGNAQNIPPPTDPTAAQTRRRRFQNLPQ